MRRNHKDAAERSLSVRQVLSEARATLADQRTMRREVGQATKRALQANRASIIRSLQAAFGREDPAGKPPAPGGAGEQKPLKAHGGVWDLQTNDGGVAENPSKEDALLQNRILRVIERHPEGILTVDVGNEIGVDWRRVLGITHCLVDEGLVEQVEHNLYPVGKASRRW